MKAKSMLMVGVASAVMALAGCGAEDKDKEVEKDDTEIVDEVVEQEEDEQVVEGQDGELTGESTDSGTVNIPEESGGEDSSLPVEFDITEVRNDTTGNFRIAKTVESINMLEYAKVYYDKYFENDDEVHAIVNFTDNTTTKISVVGGLINVTVHDYVSKEEHDAKKLFGGLLLEEEFFDKATGDLFEF